MICISIEKMEIRCTPCFLFNSGHSVRELDSKSSHNSLFRVEEPPACMNKCMTVNKPPRQICVPIQFKRLQLCHPFLRTVPLGAVETLQGKRLRRRRCNPWVSATPKPRLHPRQTRHRPSPIFTVPWRSIAGDRSHRI